MPDLEEAREQAWREQPARLRDATPRALSDAFRELFDAGWASRGQCDERVRAQKDPEVIRARDITQSTHDTTSTVGFTLVAQEPDEEVIERKRIAALVSLWRRFDLRLFYSQSRMTRDARVEFIDLMRALAGQTARDEVPE